MDFLSIHLQKGHNVLLLATPAVNSDTITVYMSQLRSIVGDGAGSVALEQLDRIKAGMYKEGIFLYNFGVVWF